ncbi:DUF1611 domain-containing protein [Roseospira navarrensis]|uniref:DUF1611 domain-containing protein n=1 Tax=Roseospira navarrensis TaxID=140058 RepID=A0A7X1ZDC8_9PROT|nr:DUF1611 domain-containing protein [Roseospira navarrensis]MQX35312.1 DUF1611 domain-containing protein [Roseospira navarrensis]
MKTENTLSTAIGTAKWAFSTRRVRRADVAGLSRAVTEARAGDLVLARIHSIGSHRRLQLASGRPSELYPQDLVVVACGDRYAADQFEGIARIGPTAADLLASGGVAGEMRERNGRTSPPTRITPMGLLLNAHDHPVNLSHYAAAPGADGAMPPTLAVAGASMNAGKTTAVASLTNGLRRAGHRIATLKITGTAAFGDFNSYLDAGAHFVADFVDAGMVSTYRQPIARIEAAFDLLLGLATDAGCDVILTEFADGILQQETAALMRSEAVRSRIGGILFAAPDALSVAGACRTLDAIGLEPLAVTGLLTQSPLASAEATAATGLSVWTRDALRDPACATALMARVADAMPRRDIAA